MSKKQVKVTFRPKGQYQKDDCIRAGDGCPNTSTLEAVVTHSGRVISTVRCCTDQKCKDHAAELARVPHDFVRS
jgi:hypothetical protein